MPVDPIWYIELLHPSAPMGFDVRFVTRKYDRLIEMKAILESEREKYIVQNCPCCAENTSVFAVGLCQGISLLRDKLHSNKMVLDRYYHEGVVNGEYSEQYTSDPEWIPHMPLRFITIDNGTVRV
jgi:hypothetical protein